MKYGRIDRRLIKGVAIIGFELFLSFLIAAGSFYLFIVFGQMNCSISECGITHHYLSKVTTFSPFMVWPAWAFKHKLSHNRVLAFSTLLIAFLGGLLIVYAVVSLKLLPTIPEVISK